MKKYQSYIDGKWVDSSSGKTIAVDNPATEKVIGEIACATNADVDIAIEAAKKSFQNRSLVDMPIMDRARLMHRIADETRKVAKEGGTLLCYENGKALAGAIKEFNDVADTFDYYAGLTDKLEGKTIPVTLFTKGGSAWLSTLFIVMTVIRVLHYEVNYMRSIWLTSVPLKKGLC